MSYEQPFQGRGRGPSPLLILGIIVFVIPFFNNIIHKDIPGWISVVGIILILIGAILSIIKQA